MIIVGFIRARFARIVARQQINNKISYLMGRELKLAYTWLS